jgi:hypothetical protein
MRAPDLESTYATAWHLPLPPPGKRGNPSWDAGLASWFVFAPEYHPFWHWYLLSVIHLRPLQDCSHPVCRSYPEAAYELLVLALDPDVEPDVEDFAKAEHGILMPPNLAYQFHLTDPDAAIQSEEPADSHAVTLLALFVKAACGGMSLDTDARRLQLALLDGAVEHIRLGQHLTS